MTNQDVLNNLLATAPTSKMIVPTYTLLDWINTIPADHAFHEAKSAYLVREPAAQTFYEQHVRDPRPIADHDAWLAAEFEPPLFSTDGMTGERLRLKQEFVETHGLLSNEPHKVYYLPDGVDVCDWLMNPEQYREYFKYMDNDGTFYELVNGQFVASQAQ